jgi:redox-sensitive bicupin YhaK (pirin superfamily)
VRLASANGAQDSIALLQDVDVWYGALTRSATRGLSLAPGRAAWIHVARGTAVVNGASLSEGDGVALEDEPCVDIAGAPDAAVLIFDLA